MLSQSFVALLASIKREKLPLWWKAKHTGWSTAQRLMLSDVTMSSLILQLLLFDIALSEFTETEPESFPYENLTFTGKDLLPGSFMAMKAEERMQELLQCARKAAVPRFQGVHGSVCCTCEDGGELLCCEFCERVVHLQCLNPPLLKPPVDGWACTPCTVDILELASND